MTTSKPPANAWPFTAAMSGFEHFRNAVKPIPIFAMSSPAANAFKSMPAQKIFSPAPVMTMARTSGFVSASVNAFDSPSLSAPFNALPASGRFNVMIKMLLVISVRISMTGPFS